MKDVLIIDKTAEIKLALTLETFSTIEFDDEVGGLNAVGEKKPVVVLLNHNIMGERTPYYINLLLESSVESNVIVIADTLSEPEILNCLLAGAKGYQEIGQLNVYAGKLVTVIKAGEAWITRRMTRILLDSLREQRI